MGTTVRVTSGGSSLRSCLSLCLLLSVVINRAATAYQISLQFDGNVTFAQQQAVYYAANRWNQGLATSGSGEANSLELRIGFNSFSGAVADSTIGYWTSYNGYALTPAQYMAQSGTDNNGAALDGQITFNSNYSWYTGTDARPGGAQQDLVAIALHEIGHHLGVEPSYSPNPLALNRWGHLVNSFPYPDLYQITMWDARLRDGNGNAPAPFITSFDVTNHVTFIGAEASYAYGGAVPIYSPNPYEEGSSLAHFDVANTLMWFGPGNCHGLTDYEVGAFRDSGWSFAIPTEVHATGQDLFTRDWNDGSTWNDGLPPGQSTNAYLDAGDHPYTIIIGRKDVTAGNVRLSGTTAAPANLSLLFGKRLTINGSLIVAPTAGTNDTVSVGSNSSLVINGSLWVGGDSANSGGAGTIRVGTNGTMTVNGSAEVAPTGVIDVQWDAPISGNGRINNAGLFKKSGGTGTSTVGFGVVFNNTGTVEVDSGTLNLGWGGTLGSGSLLAVNGSSVLMLGGGFNVTSSIPIVGTGTTQLNGSLNVGGGNNVTVSASGGATMQITGGTSTDTGSSLTLAFTGPSAVQLSAGGISGSGTTQNVGNFQWSGGSINGNFTNNSNTFSITGPNSKVISDGSTLTNAGTITHTGNGTVLVRGVYVVYDPKNPVPNVGRLNNQAGATYDLQGDGNFNNDDYPGWPFNLHSEINNAGLFKKSGGTGTSTISNIVFNNTGTVEVDSGTLAFQSGYTQTAGTTRLEGGNIAGNLNMQGGSLTGFGTVAGSILNVSGLVSPGNSPGTITVAGSYEQDSGGSLLIQLAGLDSGRYDVFNISGTATLGGTLDIALLDGFAPSIGDSFRFMTYGSHLGTFNALDVLAPSGYEFTTAYDSNGITLVTQTVPEPSCAWLIAGVVAAAQRRRRR